MYNGDQIVDEPRCPRESPHCFQIIHVLWYIDMFKSNKLLRFMDGLYVHYITPI